MNESSPGPYIRNDSTAKPSPFTDDNLKWLKQMAAYNKSMHDYYETPLRVSELEGLIARMEAAEAILEPHEDGCGVSVNLDCTCDMPKRWEVWRKAAGK